MDIWSIGPFQLKAELIISLISAAAGLAAIKIVHRKSGWHSAPVTDLVFNGLVIIFLFWKFGHVLSDPSLLWENSSLVVLASGTGKDIILGTLVAILYISAQAGKTSLDGATWLDFLAYGLTAGGSMYFILHQEPSFVFAWPWETDSAAFSQPVSLYMGILLVLLGLRFILLPPGRRGTAFSFLLIWFGLSGLIVSLFSPQTIWRWGLSSGQFVYLFFPIIGMILDWLFFRMEKNRLEHTTSRKEMNTMTDKNNSKAQDLQEQENKNRKKNSHTGGVDKKLNGPNRPST
ncbi:hypothetical protein ABNB59_13145 [Paenibacillus larvae]|uniref:Prolipoprotein diacylglyceryl transferase Lgt n=2 Tax=Paenibacillus larvae TaxID=1464 RepID=A0A6C0QXJ0_9BACL|nr:hypothetical protein [Paenibacillus larvae]AQR78302.1 hypothetical protein BXP28_14260 [Paenibacillus larvae subsp. larvae]AVF20483.1 prolipoprotein diacylglyceryl transferase Lgt [Paenibacillus larvae subsp. larvae]ETK28561.1 prolipoprotein diacylglyceryl transferase Lgt [Paenibacillus larvae subsp. larvae DSM 25719]MCY7478230.1 prolipoprotein diacylglyceryl transferase [Paenibacillus larvae]MCY7491080.1 prolipoprotein diacylglyceryl transferase [Paenibacillus larvae]